MKTFCCRTIRWGGVNIPRLTGPALLLLITCVLGRTPAAAAEVRLAWDPPTNNTDGSLLTDLAGFKICWGTNSFVYTAFVDAGNVTTGTVTGLTGGLTYYFAVRAYNTALTESSNSVELAWMAPVPDTTAPVMQAPAPVTLSADLADAAKVPDYLSTLVVSDDRTARTNIVLVQTPVAGATVLVGTTLVAIAATDEAGNRAQITTPLTVQKANRPPVVSAGANITFRLDKTGTLSGSVTDDGLPAGTTVTVAWSKLSGPGVITFTPSNAPVTTLSASAAGTYLLQLSASDQQLTATSTVTATVAPLPVPGKPIKVRSTSP
jgi:hypothetical protein